MIIRWLRRRRIRRTPFPATWEAILRNRFAQWMLLTEPERVQLRDALRFFIAERFWEGCEGLELTEPMQVLIAAQASLLLLGRPDDDFSNVTTVLVYPHGYFAAPQRAPVLGGTRIMDSGPTAVLGQAWERGPVILSWTHAAKGAADGGDGENVVFHEFAHKLDMNNGLVDGTPRMSSREQAKEWHLVMTDAFAKLDGELHSGVRGPLRRYALTNPAEFFAVATEVFFERPVELREWDDDLYRVLSRFYRQDPAARVA
jgi:Mlc titration factor MtfA (ptsG expression regulator)